MLPFEHDLFQKDKKVRQLVNIELVRDFDVENISVKKITKWYRQFLQSYRVHKTMSQF